ncbi:hypothetical protein D3C72_1970340 [compost metagenome]
MNDKPMRCMWYAVQLPLCLNIILYSIAQQPIHNVPKWLGLKVKRFMSMLGDGLKFALCLPVPMTMHMMAVREAMTMMPIQLGWMC